jgi:hypothetical protein
MADSKGQEVSPLHPLGPSSQGANEEENITNILTEADNSKANNEKTAADPNGVGWDGDNDPENPKNWPEAKKWGMVVVLFFITFLTLVNLLPG